MVDIWHYIFVQTYRMFKTKPYVNCGLSVVMTCLCRFMNCNKCTSLVGNIDGEVAMRVWE